VTGGVAKISVRQIGVVGSTCSGVRLTALVT